MSKWRDPYFWADVDVLQNSLNIRSQDELSKQESNYTQLRLYELEAIAIPGDFDLNHLKAIHKHLFQDVYPFAGELRTINISKGELFGDAREIARLGDYLFSQLHKEKLLTGLSAPEFAERAAFYFNAINAIHPFREGNGRCQRAFVEQLARHAEHTLDLGAVSNAITMVEASKQGFNSDRDGVINFDTQHPTLFIDMFQRAINPAYVDVILQARTALEKDVQKPDLIPFVDSRPGLITEGLVLAKNATLTAQMHGLNYFAVHRNVDLTSVLEPGELATVAYDQSGTTKVWHMGKPLEFPQPAISAAQLEHAKPVTRLDTVYHGKFVHADNEHIYQELGRHNIIKHEKSRFQAGQLPEIGKFASIKYHDGQAQLFSRTPAKNLDISK